MAIDQSWDYIPPQRKELYFRIIDTHPDPKKIAVHLYFLDAHMPEHKLDVALKWLIRNRITGECFIRWLQTECQGSYLHMQTLLESIVTNETLSPLIAGKNFKP